MNLSTWSKSTVTYGRRVLSSGLDGARSGREAFLHGESLTPFLNAQVRNALKPAMVGACIGVLASFPKNRSVGKTLGWGLLGAAIGLGTGFAWKSRRLTASVADGVLKNVSHVRDEHWLEKHPIDYA